MNHSPARLVYFYTFPFQNRWQFLKGAQIKHFRCRFIYKLRSVFGHKNTVKFCHIFPKNPQIKWHTFMKRGWCWTLWGWIGILQGAVRVIKSQFVRCNSSNFRTSKRCAFRNFRKKGKFSKILNILWLVKWFSRTFQGKINEEMWAKLDLCKLCNLNLC